MADVGLEIIAPGLLTTVQDLGRPGYARYGLGPGGAVDTYALRAANFLVDNPPEAAGLEITLTGPVIRFRGESCIAVCGADMRAAIDGRPIENWRGYVVRDGSTLNFGGLLRGCRSYLAVSGGIDVDVVMGSRSTDLRAGLGYGGGRAVAAGDVLPVAARPVSSERLDRLGLGLRRLLPAGEADPGDYLDRCSVVAGDGPQVDHFARKQLEVFYGSVFTVDPASDRMGLRLDGPRLPPERPDIISDALVAGAVQVPESGQPLCLLAGHQTTGGYPKIASIGQAHLRVAAQRPPFSPFSLAWAETEAIEAEAAAYVGLLRAWEAARLGRPPGRLYRLLPDSVARVDPPSR